MAALVSLGLLIGFVWGLLDQSGLWGVPAAGFVLLMGLPLLQLLAVVITFMILFFGRSRQTNRRVELRQLGRIAIGSTVGTLAGCLIMFLLYLIL